MCPRVSSFLFVLGIFVCGGLLPPPASAQSPDTMDASVQEALVTIDSLRQAGAFQAARERLEALRDEHPGRVEVLWRLAYTLSDFGKITEDEDRRATYYEEALEAAEAAVKSDSTNARAHLAMAVAEGRIALDAGTRERIQRSRAVKHHADRAIELDSTLAGAYHVRGRWHRKVDDLGFFKRVIVKTVYGGLPDASFEQSMRDFKRALELESGVHHHVELGKTYLKLDRPDAARDELRAALDLSSSDPLAPLYKKEARELLDDLD